MAVLPGLWFCHNLAHPQSSAHMTEQLIQEFSQAFPLEGSKTMTQRRKKFQGLCRKTCLKMLFQTWTASVEVFFHLPNLT
jgi:hypothetical protein